MRPVSRPCTVDAEDGTVVLECGHALVTLEPAVAKTAAAKMTWVAGVATAQQQLPRTDPETGESD